MRKMTVCIAWLHDLLLFAGCYILMPVILGMETAQADRYFAGSSWLLLPIILSWICIRKIKRFVLYLLAGAAVTVGVKILSGSLLTGILTAVIFLVRGYVRIKKGKLKKMLQEMPGEAGAGLDRELWEIPTLLDEPGALHWLVFAGYYVILLYLRKGEMLSRILYMAAADVFLVFVYRYLTDLRFFLEDHERIANLPKKSVRKAGQMLLALALPLLLAFVLPSLLCPKEPLTELKFELADVSVMPETEIPEMENGGAGNHFMDMLRKDMPEQPAWIGVLSAVLMWVFSAIILVVCIVLIYRLCRHIMQSFAAGEEDEAFFTGEEMEEQTQPVLRKKRAFRRRTDANRKIRRQYKKIIRRNLPVIPGGWETPGELEEKANAQTETVSKELHEMYEKARYSSECE